MFTKRAVMRMKSCEICGAVSHNTIECEACAARFCEDCGSVRMGLCTRCLESDSKERGFETGSGRQELEEEETEAWGAAEEE